MADKINAAGYETKPWWPYVRELMEGGGSVTVEQLNVTENGTYTAEAGKAYSPVVVNVPSGSSDFSTAEVTISTTVDTVVFVAGTYDFGDSHNSQSAVEVFTDSPVTINAILYKGEAAFSCKDGVITALQGNVVGDIGDPYGTISGTCSITLGEL